MGRRDGTKNDQILNCIIVERKSKGDVVEMHTSLPHCAGCSCLSPRCGRTVRQPLEEKGRLESCLAGKGSGPGAVGSGQPEACASEHFYILNVYLAQFPSSSLPDVLITVFMMPNHLLAMFRHSYTMHHGCILDLNFTFIESYISVSLVFTARSEFSFYILCLFPQERGDLNIALFKPVSYIKIRLCERRWTRDCFLVS